MAHWGNKQLLLMKELYTREVQLKNVKRRGFHKAIVRQVEKKITTLVSQFNDFQLELDDYYDFCDMFYEHFLELELSEFVRDNCQVWCDYMELLDNCQEAECKCKEPQRCMGPLCPTYKKAQINVSL